MKPMFAFERIIGQQNCSEGVGIGLSTSNSLATAMQGDL